LDLAGSGDHTYEAELRAIVRQLRLDAQVSFLGRVSKAELPHTFARYEALVFPSEWAEPLARAPMEALASGLVVIGTQTGGTNEILKNDVTGLSFAAGDALGLSAQIDRLLNNPALGERLARNGRQWVEARFSFVRMVDEIETLLGDIAEQSDE
jgi:glycosyltransferase involved in cell wall biosynthesis